MAAMQKDVFKPKVSKIPDSVLDVDGREVKIETRNDEEQGIKYQEIIDNLVNAGYFRARIKGLHPFDMVVGGMTWCIDTSEVDIDVDLLFEESLTIGQKIALTEKIVAVLPKVKCPYIIEPHQIQGLDFIHIDPVIKWLIKWSSENRQRKAEYLRQYAVNQFHKMYPPSIESRSKFYNPFINRIMEKYSSSQDMDYAGRNNEVHHQNIKVKRSTLKQLVCNQPSNVVQEVALKDQEKYPQILKVKLVKKLNDLILQKETLENELEQIGKEMETLNVESKEDNIDFNQFSEPERESLQTLQQLLSEREKMKQKETEFKERCRNELAHLENEISKMEKESEDTEEMTELQNQLKEWEERMKCAKQELAKKTRQVMLREKLLDNIATRAELSQYQKRIVELYNQIAIKSKETKQYYSRFNALSSKFQYQQKQYNMLNSIYDNYLETVKGTKTQREEYFAQLEKLCHGVEQSKEKLVQKRNDERGRKEKLSSQIEFLQEQKRCHLGAMKEFSAVCEENEKLITTIESLSSLDRSSIIEQMEAAIKDKTIPANHK